MTVGISGCAIGMALMSRIGPHASYLTDVLPGGDRSSALGLTLTVAPLTATVLASADVRHAGRGQRRQQRGRPRRRPGGGRRRCPLP